MGFIRPAPTRKVGIMHDSTNTAHGFYANNFDVYRVNKNTLQADGVTLTHDAEGYYCIVESLFGGRREYLGKTGTAILQDVAFYETMHDARTCGDLMRLIDAPNAKRHPVGIHSPVRYGAYVAYFEMVVTPFQTTYELTIDDAQGNTIIERSFDALGTMSQFIDYGITRNGGHDAYALAVEVNELFSMFCNMVNALED